MPNILILEIGLAGISLISLLINAYFDFKTRYASDKVWIFQILSSFCLLLTWGIFIQPYSFLKFLTIILNILLSITIGLLFFYLGTWGGGDSKALIALSFSTPFIFTLIPNVFGSAEAHPPVLLLLVNVIIALGISIFILFCRNLWNRSKFDGWFHESSYNFTEKLRLLISAIQIPINEIERKMHYDPAEKFENETWKAHLPFSMEQLTDEEFEKFEKEARRVAYKNATETNRTFIWSRYQNPGLVNFAFAYILLLLFGSPYVLFINAIS